MASVIPRPEQVPNLSIKEEALHPPEIEQIAEALSYPWESRDQQNGRCVISYPPEQAGRCKVVRFRMEALGWRTTVIAEDDDSGRFYVYVRKPYVRTRKP